MAETSAAATEPVPSGPGSDTRGREDPAATVLEVLRRLDSGPRGLTEAQAEQRLARCGENTLPVRRPPTWPGRFLRSLRDPFTVVLLCLGAVSVLVTSWGTAGVVGVLVAVSCVLRASGEHRADRAMTVLGELVASTATVVRRADAAAAPVAREVPVGLLVPGDVVRLGPGDLVPADVRLLRANGLRLYQAVLTGESVPVAKHPVDAPGPSRTGVFDQPHLCFQGSSVADGNGTAVVLATGADTWFAGRRTGWGRRGTDAFDRSLHGISWSLIRFMLLMPPLVLMANAVLRHRGLETLPFAVAVAVALTPEMLPVVLTTCLARGAARLADTHGVIVKHLPALHDLGAVDVLCLDKTGTLTQDRPVVHRALDTHGRDDPEVLRWAVVNAWWTLQLADLPQPDSLDEAVLDAGAGTDGAEQYDGVAVLPFDPVRRLATAVVRAPGRLGRHVLVVKGAAESVLERCDLDDAERARLLARAADLADAGLRVLAVALGERPARDRSCTPADERDLTLRGFVTLRDALAPTAPDALKVLASRGVTVKVLTGDHPGAAARACRDLGIDLDGGDVLTPDRLDGLTGTDLIETVRRTTVFARCTPEDKAFVTTVLRDGGHITGFLGDGVNDLPALHAADVGICPHDAAEVTRESAQVVLADKDLTAIDQAITTGRHCSGSIATYLRITLSANLGNVISMLCAGLLLPYLPMLPAQVLVQNLCFDAAQLAFAYDRSASGVPARPTTLRPRELLRFITGFGVLNASSDLVTFGILTLALHGPGSGDAQAVFHSGWFTENLVTQALVMLLLHRGPRRLRRRTPASGTAAVRGPDPVGWAALALTATGLLLPFTPLGPALAMVPLPVSYYLFLVVVLVPYAVALRVARTRYERRADGADGGGDGRGCDDGRPGRPPAQRTG